MHIFIKLSILAVSLALIDAKPEQIHLSLGAHHSEMMVTFTTLTNDVKSEVRYHRFNGRIHTIEAQTHLFEDYSYKVYIHRAKLTGLEPGHTYEYQCGSGGVWSDKLSFKSPPDHTDGPLRLAVYGDLGVDNGISVPQLKKDVENGMYDIMLHIGDIAYDLDSNNGTIGDQFMNEIQPIAGHVPYQTCPGNHERQRNFTHYLNRFTMIDTKSGHMNDHYYSFDLGPAHFIFFSTELYFYPQFFSESHIRWQYEWLEHDLQQATRHEHRTRRPWILVFGHRPMYCLTQNNGKDCYHYESVFRNGRSGSNLTKTTNYGLEDLFHKYGVDILFSGHTHIYERSYPVYNMTATKTGNYYDNPTAPVHIITGAAGTVDRPYSVENITDLPDWSAFVSTDWSFTRMNIQNKTHILFDQFSTENNKVVDSFVIKKDRNF